MTEGRKRPASKYLFQHPEKPEVTWLCHGRQPPWLSALTEDEREAARKPNPEYIEK